MASFSALETPNLRIRPIAMADIDAVQAAKEEIWHDLQLWMSWAYDDQLARSALESFVMSLPPENPWERTVAYTRDTGRLTVIGGLIHEAEGVYTTGYWCAKNEQGRGYATESTNALTRFAFTHLKAKFVNISYYEGNERSRRVIDKLGFSFVKTEVKGKKRCLDGALLDEHLFELTDPSVLPPLDWRAIAEG